MADVRVGTLGLLDPSGILARKPIPRSPEELALAVRCLVRLGLDARVAASLLGQVETIPTAPALRRHTVHGGRSQAGRRAAEREAVDCG